MPEMTIDRNRMPLRQRELLADAVVNVMKNSLLETQMLELAAIITLSAIALTFVTDATTGTMKVARSMRRRDSKIRVASHH